MKPAFTTLIAVLPVTQALGGNSLTPEKVEADILTEKYVFFH
jgi:hypothetical protein